MQYEKIILEMMERIHTLEEQVRDLQRQTVCPDIETATQNNPCFAPTARRTNTKVTDEMLEECYQMGKQLYEAGDGDVPFLAAMVHEKTGMNSNNALMTIFAVLALLQGDLYKRGISAKATDKYFYNILNDYGNGGLQRAIAAMRLHIDYRRSLHHNVDLLETVCDKYQTMI